MGLFQEDAEELVEQSINELGFVVVAFEPNGLPLIGSQESILWKSFPMPQPFTVVRLATEAERDAQAAIFTRKTGLEPLPGFFTGVPYILVTD